jgi:hypothetical protein
MSLAGPFPHMLTIVTAQEAFEPRDLSIGYAVEKALSIGAD